MRSNLSAPLVIVFAFALLCIVFAASKSLKNALQEPPTSVTEETNSASGEHPSWQMHLPSLSTEPKTHQHTSDKTKATIPTGYTPDKTGDKIYIPDEKQPLDTYHPESNTNAPAAPTTNTNNTATLTAESIKFGNRLALASLWYNYSSRLPKLYAAPTAIKLDEISITSSQLDNLFLQNQSMWMEKFTEVQPRLIKDAIEGEREAARAISFQWVRPAFRNLDESLAWAMIANAIAPNDYYLYICADIFPECLEGNFSRASELAKTYIASYGFHAL